MNSARETRRRTAEETVRLLQAGGYSTPDGTWVDLQASLTRAVESARCYGPDELATPLSTAKKGETTAEVVPLTTLEAAQSLAEQGSGNLCCLNFASARRAGGGYLSGANAQEESLARATGLVPTLDACPAFYTAHRAAGDSLYSHAIAFARDVPVFRDKYEQLLPAPWHCSMVSAPAPNLSGIKGRHTLERANTVYEERLVRILRACRDQKQDKLVLGAWGCGVFGNSPEAAAEIFLAALGSPEFNGAFEHICIAIHCAPGDSAFDAFDRSFRTPATKS